MRCTTWLWLGVLAAAACADELPITAPQAPQASLSGAGSGAAATAVLVGAGNIARCDRTQDEATARLLDNIPGTVFTTGDNTYASGSITDYNNCYGPSWGRHRARTRPAPGELDYQSPNAAGYFTYFGSAAGSQPGGYYSYTAGDWHVVVLNSAIDVTAGSPQERWLRADLAAHPARCTVAYWHHPRFSSFSTRRRDDLAAVWQALYDAGVELVLNGHYRLYERFAPQTPGGTADPQYGVRQITIGTGGISTNSYGSPESNSELRQSGTFGVLKVTLSADAYQWQYVPIAGQTFTDAGQGTCHGARNAPVASVQVAPDTATVYVGQTVQLTAIAKDVSGFTVPNAVMSWRSSDSLAARVAAGVVAGVAAGTVYVIASSQSQADTAVVRVLGTPVASVAVSPATASVPVGGSVTLAAAARDSSGGSLLGRSVTWSSSAAAIASVSPSGVVTGLAPGSATISATSEGQSGAALVTVTAAAAMRAGWYVSPSGSSTNSGTHDRPWSLTYAMGGAGGRIQPGDTVWLRGGTYAGRYRTAIGGTSSQPIVFRGYPGERATIDGSLRLDGPDVVVWGFEIMQSDPLSLSAAKVPGIETFGARTRLVNLVIHDVAQQGITFWDGADNAEVYGCIVYNNGTHENLDHGTYVHNSVGTKVLAENVFFNNLAWGIHVYAGPTAQTQRNVHILGNVSFNNGTISTRYAAKGNIIVGAEVASEGMRIIDNMLYLSGSAGGNMWVGYTAPSRDVEVRGNTVWGGQTAMIVNEWSSASIRDNRVGGPADMVDLKSSVSGHTWAGNEYYREPVAAAWRYSGTARTFTDWRLATGLGTADAAWYTLPASPRVFVRPNKYEPGRGHVVVYNWSRHASVSVDLSAVLQPGDRYEIRNVQQLWGQPVLSGTYAGGTIQLPMTGVAPPPRIGRSTPTPPVTGPHFDTFVVTRSPN
jgi:hypothetical protein